MPDTHAVHSDVYPGLTYDDASAAIDWLCNAFGFTRRLVVPGESGRVTYPAAEPGC